MSANIGSLPGERDWRIPPDTKGCPGWAAGMTGAEFVARNINVLGGDLPLPACVLREEALTRNGDAMARFLREAGPDLLLAPHRKATMIPPLFHPQPNAGRLAP